MTRAFIISAVLALQSSFATAAEPDAALQGVIDTLILPWVGDAVLTEAINAQNATTADYNEARILELDQVWRAEVGTGGSDLVDSVLTSAAADFLRSQVVASDGALTEIFIMDQHGLNVAASNPTSDYWQGDEAKFQQTYSVGPDAVHVSEIEFDESSQSYQAQVSITLTDSSGAPIGALTVGINAELIM
ncbi:hypothetical protein J7443_23415 [Tropicibacter sp. R15_0]|uniref:hypothetical protein n=1 Tax=Tropicibacter sp. R15_0 TaxID=2821101 RepID=UPI001ADA356B|nr:hypothetical protein [Tropicibacter sp. R15_0]MBO9468195.1 hypothetical protein [Tropicibacter sp. R15_0]